MSTTGHAPPLLNERRLEVAPAAPNRPDLTHQLDSLRRRLSRHNPDSQAERLLSEVKEAVERLSAEHAGMAEELLCVYEQLGIVFEVTRRLCGVRREAEVVDLFVDSLSLSFQGRDVFFVDPRWLGLPPDAEAPAVPGGGIEPRSCGWFAALVRRARDRASVLVESARDGTAPSWIAEAMVGPIFAGGRSDPGFSESFVGAIVLTRRADVEPFRASDMLLLESLTVFCGDLIRNHRLVHELRDMSIAMVRSLVNAVDQKDTYTSGHSLRVGYFATLLGDALGLKEADLRMLEWSALLHDVGKIGIRDNVLKKPGGLTKEEFDHIKEHPTRSHRVVQEVPQLTNALDGVLHHHERYDGKGYPSGLAGHDIPLQARIIQVADVFDALTSTRSYRPAYDWRKALDILKEEAGRTVDPHLQPLFDRLIRDALEGDPQGWEKMIQRAERFREIGAGHSCGTDGE